MKVAFMLCVLTLISNIMFKSCLALFKAERCMNITAELGSNR